MAEESRHDDLVAKPSKAAPSSNPITGSSNITLSVPESLEIRLVDASVLSDYEIWSLLTSVLSSAVVGFIVAYIQEDVADIASVIGWLAVVLFVVAVVTAIMAIRKRLSLRRNTKSVRFAVGEQIKDDDASN